MVIIFQTFTFLSKLWKAICFLHLLHFSHNHIPSSGPVLVTSGGFSLTCERQTVLEAVTSTGEVLLWVACLLGRIPSHSSLLQY